MLRKRAYAPVGSRVTAGGVGILLVVALLLGQSCAPAAPAPTPTRAVVTPTRPPAAVVTPVRTPSPTRPPALVPPALVTPVTTPGTPVAMVPDFSRYGFTQVVASGEVSPDAEAVVAGGPYTATIPSGAFLNPVRFEILTGPQSNVQANAPRGETPILNFAFRVTDQRTGQLVGRFEKPVTLVASDARITADSKYYNYTVAGEYQLNPTGLQVRAGELRHPISGTSVAWVITSPTQ